MATIHDADGTRIVAVVPTYNENEDLERVVDSLLAQGIACLTIIVVNAGGALPPSFSDKVVEVKVGADCFWTSCVNIGLDRAKDFSPDFVYLTNSDTYALPGTLSALLDFAVGHKKCVACSPAYIESGGDIRLLYSHQDPMGVLLYGRLVRPWSGLDDAPREQFPIVLTGGQGVLFPASVIEEFRLDAKAFPQYASDHDLWLTMRSRGWGLWVVPQGGVVNTRTLSANRASGFVAKMTKLWWRMSSEMAPESLIVVWRLRRKHLAWSLAVVSTLVSFLLRWTVGLPKILKRT